MQVELDSRLYKKLLGSLPDIILLLDNTNTIHYANQKAIDLLSRDGRPLIGENFGIPLVDGEASVVDFLSQHGLMAGELRAQDIDIHGEKFTLLSLRDITESRKLREEFDKMLLSTISTLSKTLEVRDPYTVGHESRVGHLGVRIAEKMGLDEHFCQGLYISALLHDIGKISIPTEILTKPGRIGNEEFELIKTHSRVGYEILKNIHFPWPVAEVALQHHERLDGSGYPNGLKAGEICLEAQIIAIADVAEAVMNDRPYRKGLGRQAGLDMIESGMGSKYNTDAARICIDLFVNHGYEFDDNNHVPAMIEL